MSIWSWVFRHVGVGAAYPSLCRSIIQFACVICVVASNRATPLVSEHRTNQRMDLSSYDGKIIVNTVFGTGHATTTDSPGLIGEINNPIACNFDFTENYVYLTDMNGGGLIRKLAVTTRFSSPFDEQYAVKTVWAGNESHRSND